MKQFKQVFSVIFILTLILSVPSQARDDVRVISLVPSQTEMLFHLGLGDYVAGISDYCNYPEAARSKQRVGALELNIERIMSLRPTLLVDVNNMHKKYALLFSQLGLNYVNFTVTRMDQLPKMAEELSKLIGKPEKGADFAADWQKKINEISGSSPSYRARVYFEIWDTPMQAAGNKSYIGDMIKTAGGDNILADMSEFPVVNSETILNEDPDVIVIAYPLTDKSSIERRPGWHKLQAVKNKQIYALDQDLFIRPGPRNLDALVQLKEIFSKATSVRKKNQNNKNQER